MIQVNPMRNRKSGLMVTRGSCIAYFYMDRLNIFSCKLHSPIFKSEILGIRLRRIKNAKAN